MSWSKQTCSQPALSLSTNELGRRPGEEWADVGWAAMRDAGPLWASLCLPSTRKVLQRGYRSLASSPCLVHSGCPSFGDTDSLPRMLDGAQEPLSERQGSPWAHSLRFWAFTQCLSDGDFYSLRYVHNKGPHGDSRVGGKGTVA